MKKLILTAATLYATAAACAQTQPPPNVPEADSSYIDANGTAHVTRIVPVPKTISAEAQKVLSRQIADVPGHDTLDQRRQKTDAWQARAGEAMRAAFPVKSIEPQTVAGVKCRIIMPQEIGPGKQDRVLINLHGGGFNSDSGSLTESIPEANLTKTKVIAVLYPLAPEHPFPAAVDAVVDVYKEVLKTYKPQKIAMYGTSAGAILTGEVAVKLKQLGLPLPAALGVFSGLGDFSRAGDSWALFTLTGLSGHLEPPKEKPTDTQYIGSTDLNDPVLSPVYADLKGMPPALFITSTRDALLSGTCIMHRAFLAAGNEAELVVFEALAHAFWNDVNLPESKEAHRIMSDFFDRKLGGR
ncbi:MAG: alpha/beta hydrolase fold domain-containing protein [Acidobacteriaceae bacterium]|nr:alpha/beta hydrolase fold domain-containing protein [Acidobacteriaceae bacterium]